MERVLGPMMALLMPVLSGLQALGFTARHLHPPHIPELIAMLDGRDTDIRPAMATLEGLDCPENLVAVRDQLLRAAAETCRAFDELREAPASPQATLHAYRALRHYSRAQEAVYALVWLFPPISDFFLEADAREDEDLQARIAAAEANREDVGLMHDSNERGTRGGFSIYVPEYYSAEASYPLIIALHGGSGHGRDSVWSWLRAARSRGAILLCPTSREDTWSLMEPDHDSANLQRILAFVSQRWQIDASRILLTGMSDGGTFTYLCGLHPKAPYTHLAPVAASFHPFLLQTTTPDRLKALPIRILHGALDWMFSYEMAREAHLTLSGAGANCSYEEISDLSHTYPTEENVRLIDWLNETSTAP
ncbi:MAG: phospholipase [Rhizobiales bacterium]|nr:phospholipase [Hyphomicrobiales bacterium]